MTIQQQLMRSLCCLSLVVFFSCETIDKVTSSIQRPTAKVKGVHLTDLNLDSATVAFDVDVKNPYPVSLPLMNLDYGLASGGERFLSGEADIQDVIPAQQSKVFSVPVNVRFTELLGVLTRVKPGSIVPYRADLGLSVDAPKAGALRLPMSTAGELPIPAIPDVKLEQIRWEELSLQAVEGVMRLQVVNRNEFPVDLSKLSYALSLSDMDVASAGVNQQMELAGNGGSGVLEIPISFSARNLGLAAIKMLTGSDTLYELEGIIDTSTPFGPMTFPLDSKGHVPLKQDDSK